MPVSLRPAASDPERPRFLPFLYFGLAHFCLGVACAAIAASPRSFLGPWYEGRTLAVVHLVTLGWITGSILGALYAIAPTTLRIAMPVRRADRIAAIAYSIGVTGMAGHFWIGEAWGLAGSALLTATALGWVGWKLWRRLPASPLSPDTLLPIRLALLNLALTALVGVTLAMNRLVHFLPGSVLSNVAAHAHLAALGWMAMLLLGFGQRLIPMLLPAAMPGARTIVSAAVVLQLGVLGLALALPFSTPGARTASAIAAALAGGALVFLGAGVLMLRLRHAKPRPAALPRADWGLRHLGAALGWLALTIGLGLYLAWSTPGDDRLRLVPAYATLGLLGFFGQMIVGVATRMLPVFTWLSAFGGTLWPSPPPPPHLLARAVLQPWCWLFWFCGVAALAGGFLTADPTWLRVGASSLGIATLLNAGSLARLIEPLRATAKYAR
ncbi:MAG: hypothetical protein ABI609_05930 [Acidobacteriota bacterium]